MSLGLMITSGELNVPLAASIMQYVSEVRVEQELSKPWRFAVRFEEDICGDFMENGTQKDLQPGMMIAVIVREDDTTARCLVRGPIQKVKTSIVTGGPGSWYEIHGEDRRVEMGRDTFSATYTGKASAVVKTLCGKPQYSITVETDDTLIDYQEKPKPGEAAKLTQSGTDLAFIENAARTEGFEFWVVYDKLDMPSLTDTNPVLIKDTYQFKASPPRNTTPAPAAPLTIPLIPTAGAGTLYVNQMPGVDCINTLSFTLDVDAERASSAYFTVLQSGGKLQTSQTFSPAAPVDKSGTTSAQVANKQYPILADGNGSPEEQRLRAEAALIEQSWFITATCSTSMFLYHQAIYPHQILQVQGLGDMHSGTYQVSKVVHVVNTHGHLMDLTLRRNTFSIATVRSAADASPEFAHAV